MSKAPKEKVAQTDAELEELKRRQARAKVRDPERDNARKLFKKFDKDDSGFIDADEFVQLADILGMKITKDQAVNTIKEIDLDASGTVDFDEFWDWWTSPSAKDTASAALANELRGRMLKFKTSGILADTFGPMFGIVLPGDFSAKQFIKSSFKSLSHTTTGTPLESKKKKRIRQVFEQFDKDGNGHIDPDEFKELCSKLGENMSQADIDRTLNQIDADKNGTIEFEEFYIWWTSDPSHAKDADGLNRMRTKLNGLTFAKLWRDLLGKKPTDSMKEEDPDDVSTAEAPEAATNVKAKKEKKAPKIKMIDAPKDSSDGAAEASGEGTKKKNKKNKDKQAESSEDSSDDGKEKIAGDAAPATTTTGASESTEPQARQSLEERAMTAADEVKELTAALNKKIGLVFTDLAAEIVYLKGQVRDLQRENKSLKDELEAIKKPQEVETNKAKQGKENILKKSLNVLLGSSGKNAVDSKVNTAAPAPEQQEPTSAPAETNAVEMEEKKNKKAESSEESDESSSSSSSEEPAKKAPLKTTKKAAPAKKEAEAPKEEAKESPKKAKSSGKKTKAAAKASTDDDAAATAAAPKKQKKSAEKPAEKAKEEAAPKKEKEAAPAPKEEKKAEKPAATKKKAASSESSSSSSSSVSSDFEESEEAPKSTKRKSEKRA